MSELETLKEKYEKNPEDAETCLELGIAYGEQGNFTQAVPLLRKAVELDPENPNTHYNLAVAYGIILIDDLEIDEIWEDHTDEEELFELAINGYLRVIELDPEFIEAYNNLGTLYAIRGWHKEAKEIWEKSLELDPNQDDIKMELEDLKDTLDNDLEEGDN